jgi:hypothetical protein
MSGKEIIKKPRESFIGKGTTATEIVLDGAACLAPILGLPAMGFRIINQIIEERNFKAFAEAFKQTQNAVFDFNSLNQEEKALFLINVSDIFNSVSETIRVQKIRGCSS